MHNQFFIVLFLVMQKYQSDFLKSRWLTQYDNIYCEFCGALATDIHHINWSFHWLRTHNSDGSDLIALCRNCHDYIHNKAWNSYVLKQNLLRIVEKTLFWEKA